MRRRTAPDRRTVELSPERGEGTGAAGTPVSTLDDLIVDVVQVTCPAPGHWPVLGQFLHCRNIYPAPAEAHTVTSCPRCGMYAAAQTYLETYNRRRE